MSGTGFSECAVFGEPSGSSMWSALPWSAVTRQTPPVEATASTIRPRQPSTVSIAVTAAGMTPVWPTMSGLAKLMIAKRKSSSCHAVTKAAVAARALISGLRSYVGTSRGDGDELAPLALLRALLAAAEEVRHVRVLLGLGDVQLAAAVRGDDARQRDRRAHRPEDDRIVAERPAVLGQRRVARDRRRPAAIDLGAGRLGQRTRDLAHPVGPEVEGDDRVAGPDRALRSPTRVGVTNSSVSPRS